MWAFSRHARTVVRRPAAVAALAAAVALAQGGPAQAFEITADSVALLERWDGAVRGHQPGKIDEALERIVAITLDNRRTLDPAMRLFLASLIGRAPAASNKFELQAALLGEGAARSHGAIAYLQRAAMLHMDAAIAGELQQAPVLDLPAEAPGVTTSPLLATRRMIVSRDGGVIGEMESDWNWPFARSLIDLLHAAVPLDPFPRDWYHTTAAYMFARGLYAEVIVHLTHATKLLPDDALVLFDRACYSENQGLPMNQVLLRDADPMALRRFRQGVSRLPGTVNDATRRAAGLDIPLKADANAEAERLFRRALKSDPGLAEGRVRLARLLVERKRYDEALGELKIVLDGSNAPVLRFYALLFAGRAEQALGRLDAAVKSFAEATKLFPSAQSALLAQSQLALIRADAAGALEPIGKLPAEPEPDVRYGDPWWGYRLAAGREWEDLYKALTKRAREL